MITTSHRFLAVAAALVMMYGMTSVQANPISFTLIGNVDYADPGNAFSLVDNDSITVTGIFDNAGLTGVGTESVFFGGGNTLNLDVGNMTFSEADDALAELVFTDGAFTYLSFSTMFGSDSFFDTYPCGVTCFEGQDDNLNIIEGTWTSYSAVPVPAAVWLFGSGLLGLVGIARRKKSAQ